MFDFLNRNRNAGVIGPAIGVVVLFVTVTVLVLQVTIRPWATDDYGPETHLNAAEELDGYTRTEITHVGDVSDSPDGWVPSDAARESEFPGYATYVGYGCASCHGTDGAGTTVGPSINGASARRLDNLVRLGPKTMPGYDEAHLVGDDLDLIVSYLSSRPEASPTPMPVARATATPFPVPTPTAAPASTPAATAVPGASPTPTSVPATATPTRPAVDTARLAAAQRLFLDVGCDICHGVAAEGTSSGPAIEDMTAEEIREFVRNPQRPANSRYSEAMDPYTLMDLSEEELDELIFFLLNME